MIDFSINKAALERNIRKARENGIILPTISQLKDPEKVPGKIKDRLRQVGMQDFSPLNLFRITWKNEPVPFGGNYGKPNIIELPHELTGVKARIFCLVGKWFPTGCHKVGAAYGCMVPKLVTGQFDAANQKSVWPSTGNFCRGGAFNAKILSCESIAVMPENMSQERFEWLSGIVSETLRISGGDSNVKAVFDCVNELKRTRKDAMIFNQFDEMGNHLWHYHVTGTAAGEAFEMLKTPGDRFAGVCFATGSPGTVNRYGGCNDNYFFEDSVNFCGPVADMFMRSGIISNGLFPGGQIRKLRLVIDYFSDPAVDSQIRANIELQKFLIDLYFNKANRKKSSYPLMDELLLVIKENPRRWWRVEDMAEMCNLSIDQMRRIFFERTGLTPKMYVDKIKLTAAAELLLEKNCTVSEAASRFGYKDPFHFSRRFKEIMGLSPSQYRKL